MAEPSTGMTSASSSAGPLWLTVRKSQPIASEATAFSWNLLKRSGNWPMIRTSVSVHCGRRYGLLPGSDGLSYDALKASAFEHQDLKAALALASE